MGRNGGSPVSARSPRQWCSAINSLSPDSSILPTRLTRNPPRPVPMRRSCRLPKHIAGGERNLMIPCTMAERIDSSWRRQAYVLRHPLTGATLTLLPLATATCGTRPKSQFPFTRPRLSLVCMSGSIYAGRSIRFSATDSRSATTSKLPPFRPVVVQESFISSRRKAPPFPRQSRFPVCRLISQKTGMFNREYSFQEVPQSQATSPIIRPAMFPPRNGVRKSPARNSRRKTAGADSRRSQPVPTELGNGRPG